MKVREVEYGEDGSNAWCACVALEQQLQNLQLEHQAVENSAVVQVPLMKHSLSLYANITKIKWDFSSDNIAGSMINTDTGKRSFKRSLIGLMAGFRDG